MNIVEFIQRMDVGFTDEDKEACLPTVERMYELATKARQYGLLAFEADVEQEDNLFFKTAMSHMVDGLDWKSIEGELQLLILADNHKGAELLSRLIVLRGCECIMQGDNPRIIYWALLSMLGEIYLERRDSISEEPEKNAQIIRDFRDNYIHNLPPTEYTELESLFVRMNDHTVQRVFREISPSDFDTYLGRALQGISNTEVWHKVFKNLSMNRQLQLISTIERLSESCGITICSAQEWILDVIKRLEDEGEIIIWREEKG